MSCASRNQCQKPSTELQSLHLLGNFAKKQLMLVRWTHQRGPALNAHHQHYNSPSSKLGAVLDNASGSLEVVTVTLVAEFSSFVCFSVCSVSCHESCGSRCGATRWRCVCLRRVGMSWHMTLRPSICETEHHQHHFVKSWSNKQHVINARVNMRNTGGIQSSKHAWFGCHKAEANADPGLGMKFSVLLHFQQGIPFRCRHLETAPMVPVLFGSQMACPPVPVSGSSSVPASHVISEYFNSISSSFSSSTACSSSENQLQFLNPDGVHVHTVQALYPPSCSSQQCVLALPWSFHGANMGFEADRNSLW